MLLMVSSKLPALKIADSDNEKGNNDVFRGYVR